MPLRYLLFVLCWVSLCAWSMAQPPPAAPDYVRWVDPLIDTHKSRWFYFNSASRPFGLVNLSPDTNTKGSWNSGYLYDSLTVRGFSHLHGWQTSGISVLPVTGDMIGHEGPDRYRSSFSHLGEIVRPGYHKIHLNRYDVTAELTSTNRVGLHRYAFRNGEDRHIYFDTGAFLAHAPTLRSEVRQVGPRELEGYAVMGPTRRRPKPFTVYFVAQLDTDIQEFGGWQAGDLLPAGSDRVGGADAGAWVTLGRTADMVQLKVALSFVSPQGARNNLKAELDHWDFDRVVTESHTAWNEQLGRLHVEGGSPDQRTKFYTDLWHALLGRRMISDVDGQYPDNTGPETVIRRVALDENGQPRFPHYNFDAWWGSHWSLDILWSLAYPERMDGFATTMVDMYRNGGTIPRGPSGGNYTYVMIGDPAAAFFASAINRGLTKGYDPEEAYAGLRKNALPGGIRDRSGYEHRTALGGGMDYYVERGYVPEGIDSYGFHNDGASMTLEYAYQDWCLAQIARKLGKETDYERFLARSQNYRKLWNPATEWMHPRETDGGWMTGFQPVGTVDGDGRFSARGFCEANSAIYTFFVPHDPRGLGALMGGTDVLTSRLNESFARQSQRWLQSNDKDHALNWVDYGNQPSTGMAHLFNKVGAPWLSQKWVREVKNHYADVTPYGGYNGDEDQGQMGALGVLMAIGLFSFDGSAATEPTYDITTPLFPEIRIQLSPEYYSGKTFTIRTSADPGPNLYIQSARLNGRKWEGVSFEHAVLARGGELLLEVGPQPNKGWGITE